MIEAARRPLEDMKIAALSRGARVSAEALNILGGADALTVHEYSTTGGIPLKVAGLDINVPFDEWYCADADIDIEVDSGSLVLRHGGHEYAVEEVYPLPSYLDRLDSTGAPMGDVAYTHIERLRLSPITGCAYDCAFCDLPGKIRLRSVQQMKEAAEAAFADPRLPVRHALISGGSPGPRDEEAFAATLIELVKWLAPRCEVDVMMSSSAKGPELVRALVDVGVHGFALNLEVETSEAAGLHIRGKHRRSRPHFDATVDQAVALLGNEGRVRSLILPGLESVDETLRGVEHIASMGADPVLSPFRPAIGTALHRRPPVSTRQLREVLDGARDVVSRHGVALGPRCVPCQHNTLTFPWDLPGHP